MNKIFPDNIKHAAIIAPAGSIPVDNRTGYEFLEKHGIKVTVMPHVYSGCDATPWISANLEERLSDLHACWRDDSIDIVLCVRGGFGSAQLLPYIDWELLRQRRLPLIGYSDITALHLGMLKNHVGIPIAAPMFGKLFNALEEHQEAAFTAEYYRHALLDNPARKLLDSGLEIIRPGSTEGPLVACNLAVLTTLCGTPYMPDFSGAILLLEDLNEPVYKIDRYLTQLEQNGIIAQCSGLIFGSFLDCGEPEMLANLVRRFTETLDIPVLGGFPFGHDFPMACVRQGRHAVISGDGKVFV